MTHQNTRIALEQLASEGAVSGFEIRGESISIVEGGAIPSAETLAAALQRAEAKTVLLNELNAIRAQIRTDWEAQPDFITGPMGALFESGQKHLDEGKPGRAYELIKHAQIPPTYSTQEAATAEAVRASILAEINKIIAKLNA